MEQIREGLAKLFDEMIPRVPKFRRKTYEEEFEAGKALAEAVAEQLSGLLDGKTQEEKETYTEELAAAIPDYAAGKMKGMKKSEKNRQEVEYNMCMAVYVIPLLKYVHNGAYRHFAERVVALWNEKGVTSLTLGDSSYEEISGGFRKGILGFFK